MTNTLPDRDEILKKYDELVEALKINKYELDEELVHQPQLYQRVGEQWALATSIRDQLEKDIKTKEGEYSLFFRQMAADEREKTTEDKIKSQVATHPNMVKLQQDYVQWKYVANLWAGLSEAFQQRPEMIRYLVKLNLASYYMDTSVRGTQQTGKETLAHIVRREQTANRKPLKGAVGDAKRT